MENEYLNPAFKNYTVPKRDENYSFLNPELAPEGALVDPIEPNENDNLWNLADEELKNTESIHKIVSIDKKIDNANKEKIIYGMLAATFTIGTMVAILSNRDLTSSITQQINGFAGSEQFKETLKAFFTPGIIGTITASAITWANYVKKGKQIEVYKEELKTEKDQFDNDKLKVNYLEINDAVEKSTERRLR